LKPESLRTNCSAEARISSSVAGGSKLNSVLMLRHIGCSFADSVAITAGRLLSCGKTTNTGTDMLLQDHIAAVTGPASGLRRAIAIGYAREGARVVVLDVNADAAAETTQQILNAGGKAQHFALDVTDREACRAIAAKIEIGIGKTSILVNNA